MTHKSNAFKSTKISSSAFPKDSQDKLEEGFTHWEFAKADAVAAERTAAKAAATAQIARQKATIAEVELLVQASAHDNRIASEKLCMMYKDKDGIIFEVFSERILRNTFRAQVGSAGRQAEEQFPEDGDIFEQDNSEE